MRIILMSLIIIICPFIQIAKCNANEDIKGIEDQIKYFEDISNKSTDPSIFTKGGNLYWKKAELLNDEKWYKESIICFRKALVLDSNWMPAKIGIGKCYYRTGWLKPAKDIFEDVLKFYPNDKEAIAYLEKIKEDLKKENKVMDDIQENKKNNTEVTMEKKNNNIRKEDWIDKATLPYLRKEYDKVIKECEEGIKIYPDYWRLYELLGKAYKKKGNYEFSKQMFLKAKEFNPSFKTEDDLTLEEKQLLEINETMEKAVDDKNFDSLRMVMVRYEEMIKKKPEFIDAYFGLGTALSFLPDKERDIEKILGLYKQVLIIEPKNTQALFNIKNIYKSIKKYDEALKVCDMILNINKDDKSAMYSKITILSEMQDYQKVEEECEKLLNKYPDDEVAKSHLKTVNTLLKTNKDLNYIIDKQKKELSEKKSKLLQAVKEKPTFAVYSDLGDLYWEESRETDAKLMDNAFESWKKVIELEPNWGPAYINIGKYYYQKKMYKEAKEKFNYALELDPENKTALEYIKKIKEVNIK